MLEKTNQKNAQIQESSVDYDPKEQAGTTQYCCMTVARGLPEEIFETEEEAREYAKHHPEIILIQRSYTPDGVNTETTTIWRKRGYKGSDGLGESFVDDVQPMETTEPAVAPVLGPGDQAAHDDRITHIEKEKARVKAAYEEDAYKDILGAAGKQLDDFNKALEKAAVPLTGREELSKAITEAKKSGYVSDLIEGVGGVKRYHVESLGKDENKTPLYKLHLYTLKEDDETVATDGDEVVQVDTEKENYIHTITLCTDFTSGADLLSYFDAYKGFGSEIENIYDALSKLEQDGTLDDFFGALCEEISSGANLYEQDLIDAIIATYKELYNIDINIDEEDDQKKDKFIENCTNAVRKSVARHFRKINIVGKQLNESVTLISKTIDTATDLLDYYKAADSASEDIRCIACALSALNDDNKLDDFFNTLKDEVTDDEIDCETLCGLIVDLYKEKTGKTPEEEFGKTEEVSDANTDIDIDTITADDLDFKDDEDSTEGYLVDSLASKEAVKALWEDIVNANKKEDLKFIIEGYFGSHISKSDFIRFLREESMVREILEIPNHVEKKEITPIIEEEYSPIGTPTKSFKEVNEENNIRLQETIAQNQDIYTKQSLEDELPKAIPYPTNEMFILGPGEVDPGQIKPAPTSTEKGDN